MYTYNQYKTIRTRSRVEIIYSTHKGFIGRLPNVEYKQHDGTWVSQGSRWLINESDPGVIMDSGFKPASF
jgi:hypothetical protein